MGKQRAWWDHLYFVRHAQWETIWSALIGETEEWWLLDVRNGDHTSHPVEA